MGKKGGKKGKKGGKKGKKGGKKGKKWSTKKKVAVGAGVAALAIGGLAIGKYAYDKSKKSNHGGSRAAGADDGPIDPALAPYMAYTQESFYKSFTQTIYVPDTLTVGAGWTGTANLDLLGSCFDAQGNNVGYISGKNQVLFNNALKHTGDDAEPNASGLLGDDENIVCDLSLLPSNVHTVAFGLYIHTGTPTRAYIHVCPMMRESQLPEVGTRGIVPDSDSDSDSEEEGSGSGSDSEGEEAGTRDVAQITHDEHQFVTIFHAEPTANPEFLKQRGYAAAKVFRNPSAPGWLLSPIRATVLADANYGIWPSLEHYARLPAPAVTTH